MSEYPNDEMEYEEEAGQSVTYMDSGERARENRSSAWALLLAGDIGLAAVALGLLGVLPLRLGNPYLFYGVTCAIFLLFLVMGIVSMKSARQYAGKAEAENTLRDTILRWCLENLRAEEIDAQVELNMAEADAAENGSDGEDTEGELPEEVVYLRRVEYMTERINRQFMNLDQNFVGHFIDESLYDEIFAPCAPENGDK